MSTAPAQRAVEVNGDPCRVWEKGTGAPLGYLPGLGGLVRWTPFLDALAEHRRVVAPSLPGFPGARGHDRLDDQLDWLLATRDLLVAAGLEGADLVASSVGGALAADAAACWPGLVARIALIAPLGLFVETDPVADVFAQRPGDAPALLCADPERYLAATEPPDGADRNETEIDLIRASEAAARVLWPVLDTGLVKRLPRLSLPVLLLWGSQDRVVPFSYAERFAALIPGETRVERVCGAGHLAELDRPNEVARAVLEFLG